ncbi:hypothetical protein, partial [Corynebacterium variabile]|uniref:hypothetical protein n=1 Tax=Corynebacterium variabile TaxID=1727 RepID=UPI003F9A4539
YLPPPLCIYSQQCGCDLGSKRTRQITHQFGSPGGSYFLPQALDYSLNSRKVVSIHRCGRDTSHGYRFFLIMLGTGHLCQYPGAEDWLCTICEMMTAETV